MTEAGWTRGKDVKVEGWYWWEVEEETGLSLKVVQVEKGFTWIEIENEGRDVLYVVGYGGLLENKPGRFKGPITPDSYQQGRVAGLREAAEMVEDDCYIEGGELLPDYEHRCKHNVNQKELAGKIRFRAKLAQQAAQDEKGVGE